MCARHSAVPIRVVVVGGLGGESSLLARQGEQLAASADREVESEGQVDQQLPITRRPGVVVYQDRGDESLAFFATVRNEAVVGEGPQSVIEVLALLWILRQ